MSPSLLLIEDEPMIADLVQTIAEDMGYQVELADTLQGTAAALSAAHPDIVVMDLNLPGVRSEHVLQLFSDRGVTAPITLATGSDGFKIDAVLTRGRELGLNMQAALSKPFDIERLESLLGGPTANVS